jgi:hypothetical protein
VGLLTDDVSAVFCNGFVGSDIPGKDAVNFSVTSFDGRCMGTTGSCLAGIVVSFLWFSVACSVTSFSGLILSLLYYGVMAVLKKVTSLEPSYYLQMVAAD